MDGINWWSTVPAGAALVSTIGLWVKFVSGTKVVEQKVKASEKRIEKMEDKVENLKASTYSEFKESRRELQSSIDKVSDKVDRLIELLIPGKN